MGRIRFHRHLTAEPDELRPPAGTELVFRACMEGGPGEVEVDYRLPDGGPVAFEVEGERRAALDPDGPLVLPQAEGGNAAEVRRSVRLVWTAEAPARDRDTVLLTATLRPLDDGRSRGTRTMLTLLARGSDAG